MYRLYSGKYTRGLLVEMVLAEGEIEFERIEVDIFSGEEKQPEYLAINPAGWVPSLVCPDGLVLTETPAINLYLGERHRITSLVPVADDPDRGRFLSSLFYITGEIEHALKRYWYPHTFGDGDESVDAIRESARACVLRNFLLVERRLEANGPFHLGERFSLPDLMIAYWALSFDHPAQLGQMPGLQRCIEHARAMPRLEPLFRSFDEIDDDFVELAKDL